MCTSVISPRGFLQFLFMVFCGIALFTRSVTATSCPDVEAALALCPINRTAILTELYASLASPGDSTGCAPKSAIQRAYRMLVPLPLQMEFGENFDERVFINCDLFRDNWFCPIDIANTKCTCAYRCVQLETAQTMVRAMERYPDWSTTGVLWNNYRVY